MAASEPPAEIPPAPSEVEGSLPAGEKGGTKDRLLPPGTKLGAYEIGARQSPTHINVVENRFEELKRRVPASK